VYHPGRARKALSESKTTIMKTINKDGITYPVLDADKHGYITCPFCQEKHKHGKAGGDGHRVADCTRALTKDYILTKYGVCEKKKGYFVQFPK